MTWWESVWRTRAGAGDDVAWVEPEFGPAPYLWALPHTRAPVADLWRVNAVPYSLGAGSGSKGAAMYQIK